MRTLLPVVVATAMGLFLCVSCGCQSGVRGAGERVVAPTGFVFKTVTIGERSLRYVVYVPRGYDAGKRWPAIVFLHGSGESGTDGQKQIAQGIGHDILWNAGRWPCIVLMAQKPVQEDQWEKYDDLVMKMLEETRKGYAIDGDRVALTGLSQGGHGTWSIGAAHPDVWCALAPICGYADAHDGGMSPHSIAAKVKGIPVWCFHGADDDVVLPAQSQAVVDALKAAGAEPKFTLYPKTNHGSWDKAYGEKELPGFLMTARKK